MSDEIPEYYGIAETYATEMIDNRLTIKRPMPIVFVQEDSDWATNTKKKKSYALVTCVVIAVGF